MKKRSSTTRRITAIKEIEVNINHFSLQNGISHEDELGTTAAQPTKI
jgi:hypothetical protein